MLPDMTVSLTRQRVDNGLDRCHISLRRLLSFTVSVIRYAKMNHHSNHAFPKLVRIAFGGSESKATDDLKILCIAID